MTMLALADERLREVQHAVPGQTPGSWLVVDGTMRVVGADGAPIGDGWLYAAGDVNRRVLLTHQGKYQARAAGDVIVARAKGELVEDGLWGRHAATADERAVPQVVFAEPEIASVGLTAANAEAAGLRIRVVDYDLAAARAPTNVREIGGAGRIRRRPPGAGAAGAACTGRVDEGFSAPRRCGRCARSAGSPRPAARRG